MSEATNIAAQQTRQAILLGNGPSLARIDLARDLSGLDSFGMNAAYRFWREIDWYPTYYACLDVVVGESHLEAIGDLVADSERNGIQRFLLRENIYRQIAEHERTECYEDLVQSGALPRLADVTTGSHTLLWARHLGYQTLLLAGVDLDYVEQVEGAVRENGVLRIETDDGNPNYFFEGYQQPGDRYNIPNPRPGLHLSSWANVATRLVYPSIVVNLNDQSALNVFVKNRCDNMTVPGAILQQTSRAASGRARRLRGLTCATDAFNALSNELEALVQANPWNRALIYTRENEFVPERHWALFYEQGRERFRLHAPRDRLQKTEDVKFVMSSIDGLFFDTLLGHIESIARKSANRKLTAYMRQSCAAIGARLPERIRKIDTADNMRDFIDCYFSIRGLIIILCEILLASTIAVPTQHPLQFASALLVLFVMVPLVRRR